VIEPKPTTGGGTGGGVRTVLHDAWRLLTFRAQRDELDRWGRGHLVLGLLATWLVGIGRWWDDPNASPLQKTGLGSVAYTLALALVLFLVAWPLGPRAWSYRHVLTFVTLTAPPAILYAIPVERLVSMPVATQLNLWFLLVVATWRVGLLLFYFLRHAALGWWRTLVSVLLPLSAIVVSLTLLNLSRGVIQIMGGLRDENADQLANDIVLTLGTLAFLAAGPLFVAYLVGVLIAWGSRGKERTTDA
jgi:hypothetical protein